MGRVIVTEQGHAFGWRPDLPDHRDFLVEPPARDLIEEITKVPKLDLSVLPFMPSIWNQGQLGSCTAHSVGVAYEFAAHASGHPEIGTPSRLFIYYGERVIEHSVNDDAGAEIRDGFKVLSQGVPPETDWPYDISKFAVAPPLQAVEDAPKHLTTVYKRVGQTVNGIKAILYGSGGRPVSYGFTVYDSFESEVVASTGIVPMPKPHEGVLGGHAVAIVGWDDTLSSGGLTGFFKVRNSWDTSWGQDGYFWMPYSYIVSHRLCSDFWTAEVSA